MLNSTLIQARQYLDAFALKKLEYPARYSQEKLFGLYRVKWHLDRALEILGML
ncbi:MAG: hypothetical protein V7L14_00010 [Nostoc sp.]|uniref:hypothetical protein n=1 Tax=Nostoc sp. TaxID=1180 RepID=UPI002FF72A94